MSQQKVVYFPSCINRSMGKNSLQAEADLQLTDLTHLLLNRAGYQVIYPEKVDGLCCGMPFSSKGFVDTNCILSQNLENSLLQASTNGQYPILYDMSPCFYHSKDQFSKLLTIVDPIEFMLSYIMPKLTIKHKNDQIAIFPVCSLKKIDKLDHFIELASLLSHKTTVIESNCCGFAGDRGFHTPELLEHGLRDLRSQIPSNCTQGYCTSRTCEIGLEKVGRIDFKSIFYLIEELSR